MKEKCIELRIYFYEQLLKEYNVQVRDELELVVLAGKSVGAYCDFMTMFRNTDYNWTEMKNNLYFKGTGVEW